MAEEGKERILVAGCGYVGSQLAGRLVRKGMEVWGLRRRSTLLPRGVQPLAGDVVEAEKLSSFPRGVTQVVYAVSPDAREEASYRKAYVEGLYRLLDRLHTEASAPLRRFILVTSTAVYGENRGGWVDEDTAADPVDFRGRVLLEAEAVLEESGVPGVALRLGGIYGPGRTRLVDRVRAGKAQCPPGVVYGNRIHRDDSAGALEHLLFHPKPERVYLGVDDEPADRCAVLRWLAREVGVTPPDPEESAGAVLPAGKRCSNRRLRASGYDFHYPSYREGYRAVV